MYGHHAARQYSDQMYCSQCERTWDVNDAEPPPCTERDDTSDALRYMVHVSESGRVTTPYDKRTTALVGFLAAKLALHEPDCPTVKEALEWLRDARS